MASYQEVMSQTDELEQLCREFKDFGRDPEKLKYAVAPKATMDQGLKNIIEINDRVESDLNFEQWRTKQREVKEDEFLR